MTSTGNERFSLDPRTDEIKKAWGKEERWEDVGWLDDVDLPAIFEFLRERHDIFFGKGSEMLELGIGKGKLFNRLKTEGYKITGIDARKRPEHSNLTVAHLRIEEMPFDRNSAQFDVVLGGSFIDPYVYDQHVGLMIKRIHEAVKLGGVFIYGDNVGVEIPEAVGFREIKLPDIFRNVQVFKKWREAV